MPQGDQQQGIIMVNQNLHTMQTFLNQDFLLESEAARKLYHEYASAMPIIDYHCHLVPGEIAENTQYKNITQVWLYGDHYKWRAMRTFGIEEKFITGEADDWEKFEQWARVIPYTIRNPLYHWTHLELQRYFGIRDVLNPSSSRQIFEETNRQLQSEGFKARALLEKMKVEIVCTTDDPVDDLRYHQQLRDEGYTGVRVYPTWRPDKVMAIDKPGPFNEYMDKLAAAARVEILSFNDMMTALLKRHDYFHENQCRLSDHGIETFYDVPYTKKEIEKIFRKARKNKELSKAETLKFKSAMLFEFAKMDAGKGWTQQFHFGVLRNNNSLMFEKLGPDSGFDSIGQFDVASPMIHLFDRLNRQNKLAKTILYNINPNHNEIVATLIGNFNDGSFPGKMQFGTAWWFLDQIDGMTRQINALSNMGLLSKFVGMLTDSRSFLSFPRHEYFRRILCGIIGDEMERGLIPGDFELTGSIVQDICYHNARNYFQFPE